MRGSLLHDGKQVPKRAATRQPCFVLTPTTGSRDAEAVLSDYDYGNVEFIAVPRWLLLCGRVAPEFRVSFSRGNSLTHIYGRVKTGHKETAEGRQSFPRSLAPQ